MTHSTPAANVRYVSAGPPASLDDSVRARLDTISRKITGRESIEQAIDFLFQATHDLYPCDRVGLAFLTDDDQRIRSHYVRADYEPIRLGNGYVEELAGSSLAEVLLTGRCRIISDLQAYLQANPDSHSTRLLVDEGVRSSLTCPLYVDGRIVGVLFRSSRQPDSYDESMVALHQAVAEPLSQAVEKIHIIDQLRQVNRAYMEMLGFVSHELKSPVSSMITDATVLADGYAGEINDKQQSVLQRMMRKGHHLLNIVGEYLDLARIESGEMKLRARNEVDFISEVAQPAIELVQAQLEQQEVDFTIEMPDAMPGCQCDAELMKIVLVNYLSNAVKYGRRSNPQVRLAVRRDEAGISGWVWNAGQGFTPVQRRQLFRKFSRLSVPAFADRKGTGVGLYAVWKILQLHGGSVDATSEPGQWARFEFFLPQPLPERPEA